MITLARRGFVVALLVSSGVACQPATTWYQDADGDGFGNDAVTMQSGGQPSGYVDRGGDCDDTYAGAYLGAPVIEGNGIDDNDCNAVIDEVSQEQ